jgi:putative heme-binding domain-containing protein
VTYLVETTDGKVHTGLLASKTDKEVVLRTAQDKEVRIPAGKVERLAPQRTSLMPELLLRDLTAEQAADLLEFLASLRN